MRRVTSLVAVAAVATMALAACGSDSSTSSTTPSGSAAASSAAGGGEKIKVGLAYDIGGRGDKSFNDSAAAGLDKAKTDLGVEAKASSGQPG